MIPNIFISSTISDLQYLRDAIRDAICELRYRPVMSEHAEVGYISGTSAVTSCYRTVEQCQLVILIIGKRYGSVADDGLSVTHSEYRAAQKASVPTITLVEQQVLHYKEVFDASPNADLWTAFSQMDDPIRTFQLINDVSSSSVFNGLIAFTSAADAKEKLKLQIADFVGNRLGETIAPMSNQIKDVLAEIRTLRNQMVSKEDGPNKVTKYFAVTRYLLDDNVAEYRQLLEHLYGDIGYAVSQIYSVAEFPEVVTMAGYSYEIVPRESLQWPRFGLKEMIADVARPIFGQMGGDGGCIIYESKNIAFSQERFDRYCDHQKAIHAKANVV